MTVIARFEVIPVRDGSMSRAIASALRALDRHPVSYETTATDTIIEADTVDQVFAAVQAAHEAIPEDRVITSVEIDEDRRRPQTMADRVASVERELGHPPQRRQQGQPPGVPAGTQPRAAGPGTQPSAGGQGTQPPAGGQQHQQPRQQAPGRSAPPGRSRQTPPSAPDRSMADQPPGPTR